MSRLDSTRQFAILSVDRAVRCRYVSSWIDTREVQSERANLTILFDKYIPPCLGTKFKKITPIGDNSHLQVVNISRLSAF